MYTFINSFVWKEDKDRRFKYYHDDPEYKDGYIEDITVLKKFINNLTGDDFKLDRLEHYYNTYPFDLPFLWNRDSNDENCLTLIVYKDMKGIAKGGTLFNIPETDFQSKYDNKWINKDDNNVPFTDEYNINDKVFRIDNMLNKDEYKFVLFNSYIEHTGELIDGEIDGVREIIVSFFKK